MVAEAKAKEEARQQPLMEAATTRQRAEVTDAGEAEARTQAQVVVEAKGREAALQQAWMEAATVATRQ